MNPFLKIILAKAISIIKNLGNCKICMHGIKYFLLFVSTKDFYTKGGIDDMTEKKYIEDQFC